MAGQFALAFDIVSMPVRGKRQRRIPPFPLKQPLARAEATSETPCAAVDICQ